MKTICTLCVFVSTLVGWGATAALANVPTVGSRAPDFRLAADDGKTYSLSRQRGRWVVLAFYPADMTPGCTLEARSLRDAMPKIMALGAVVFGVSVQDTASHKQFCIAERLNYRLLADAKRRVSSAYGVLAEPNGVARRVTFLIDPKGIVRAVDTAVNPATHGRDVIAKLRELKAGRVK
ncbi:MAG: peroxiredoxin [Armatimonadota bacterium]